MGVRPQDIDTAPSAALQLPELRLLSIDAQLMDLIETGPEAIESLGVRFGESLDAVHDVLEQTLSLLRSAPRPDPWGYYLAVDHGTCTVIGTCGFKGALSSEGDVEIAYFTYPACEGNGYATAMVQQLLDLARQESAQRVVACTAPTVSASGRVLEKSGFYFAGELMDPEDGRLWRWERPLGNFS